MKTKIENAVAEAEAVMDKLGGGRDHPYEIGAAYFFRTLTYFYTGRLVRVLDHELVISDAAWIPDSGRWAQAISAGALADIEPYPDGCDVIIPRDGTSACRIAWPLPRAQK